MPHPRSAQTPSRSLRARLCGAAVLAGLVGALLLHQPSRAADEARRMPPLTMDTRPAGEVRGSQSVVLAGGCFWGVQGVFEHVRGVEGAVAGYAGGAAETADYATVSTGATGHAEAVRVTYDPAQISYG